MHERRVRKSVDVAINGVIYYCGNAALIDIVPLVDPHVIGLEQGRFIAVFEVRDSDQAPNPVNLVLPALCVLVVCPCSRSRPHDSDRKYYGCQNQASGLHHSSVSNRHDSSSQIIV